MYGLGFGAFRHAMIGSIGSGGGAYPASLKLFIDAGNPASYSGSGTTVTDLIGTQNGTLINGVGYSSANGGYFTLNGTNQYIDLGLNNAIRPVSARTISMWVNISSGFSVFYSDTKSSGYEGVDIFNDANGVRSDIVGTSTYQVANMNPAVNNVWVYLTLAFDGTTFKTYYNGVQKTSVAQTTVVVNNNTANSLIGTWAQSTTFLNGKFSQIKIYNEMRDATDILTDFNEFKARYGY